ncbi:hypothetical protein ACU686_42365 [Yinghuangia aomiensis]
MAGALGRPPGAARTSSPPPTSCLPKWATSCENARRDTPWPRGWAAGTSAHGMTPADPPGSGVGDDAVEGAVRTAERVGLEVPQADVAGLRSVTRETGRRAFIGLFVVRILGAPAGCRAFLLIVDKTDRPRLSGEAPHRSPVGAFPVVEPRGHRPWPRSAALPPAPRLDGERLAA